MSCAELLYHHQNLASGFPHHQRSISDVYSNYSNFTSASSAFNNDHNANPLMGGARMHHQGRNSSPANSVLPGVGATLSSSGHLPTAFPTSSSSLGPAGHRAPTSSSGSPHRTMSSRHVEPPAASNYVTTPSSTPPLSSPPAAALTPSLPYFPAVTSAAAASPPSSSSAFAFRPPTQELSPSAAFTTAPPHSSTFFFPPSHGHAYPSSPPYTPAASKRSASEASDELDDDAMPKKTRYVNANCVLLTYHTKETSSEVDDHFSKALSVSSPCRYDSLGQTSSDGASMAQRNFPPSFWDSNYYLSQQQLYNAYSAYSAFPHPTGSQSAAYLGHDALYPGLSAGWLGTAGSLQYPGLSSLQAKDPWGGFPFAASSCSAGSSKGSSLGTHHYPYSRLVAAGYPDHPLPGGYGSGRLASANFLFPSSSPSSASSAVASPTSSTRPGHYPSATITSAAAAAAAAQCASGDPMGLRMTSLAGGLSRNQFASGSGLLAGQF